MHNIFSDCLHTYCHVFQKTILSFFFTKNHTSILTVKEIRFWICCPETINISEILDFWFTYGLLEFGMRCDLCALSKKEKKQTKNVEKSTRCLKKWSKVKWHVTKFNYMYLDYLKYFTIMTSAMSIIHFSKFFELVPLSFV